MTSRAKSWIARPSREQHVPEWHVGDTVFLCNHRTPGQSLYIICRVNRSAYGTFTYNLADENGIRVLQNIQGRDMDRRVEAHGAAPSSLRPPNHTPVVVAAMDGGIAAELGPASLPRAR